MNELAAAERLAATQNAFRVLIVDDDPDMVAFFGRLLAKEAMSVDAVYDGAAALAHIAATPPDLVLLDVMMPRKSGYEVCQRVRGRPEWRHIKIIMLSAKGREVEVSKGVSLGADLYITKPFSNTELVAKIDGLLAGTP